MTTVTKEEYWPAILANPAQHGQIETSDAEWNKRAACVYEVLKNTLCACTTEILVQQWEENLELSPAAGATLNDRKAACLYKMCCALPCTLDIFKKSLEVMLGIGKYVVEHLQEENKLIVHTDRLQDKEAQKVSELIERVVHQSLEIVRYNHYIAVSWRDINKYAECKTVADMQAVNADYKNDLTPDGEWIYPLPKFNAKRLFDSAKNLKKFAVEMPSLTTMDYMFYLAAVKEVKLVANKLQIVNFWLCQSLEIVECIGEKITTIGFSACPKLRIARFDSSKIINANYCYDNSAKLEEIPMRYPALSSGFEMFRLSQFNLEQASELLGSLPTWTDGKKHEIKIGIHVDYKTNPDMLSVIENTEAKGWTLTVVWNGTATTQTASTWGLRRPPIYAKAVEYNGEPRLAWGHYVTNWEANGYQEFGSEEEAREYYGITEQEEQTHE
jgi:hypothetical protein